MQIGIHLDTRPKTILDDISKLNNKIKVIQIFVNNETIQNNKLIYNKMVKLLKKNKIKLIVHASYTINLASNWNEFSPHINQFISEIICADYLKAKYIVVHLGKQLKLDIDIAYNNMYSSLLYAHQQTKNHKIKILLETSSGQGSELCYKLEDLAYFYNKIKDKFNNRFGICLDTCHIFQAGYDISDKTKTRKYLKEFNNMIGLNHIKIIHLNDSKNKLGQNIDRHANIGHGYIGRQPILDFVNYFIKLDADVMFVLETPDRRFD